MPGALGGAAAAAAGAGALWASQSGRRASGQQRPGVDPSLFGPVNSLNGMVTPVPFEDNHRYSNGYDRRRDAPSQVTESVDNVPMRQVYPVPTSRPDQFDARHSDSLAGSRAGDLPQVARPGPAPIQAPVPIAPVSSKVYDAQSLAVLLIPRGSSSRARRLSRSSLRLASSKLWASYTFEDTGAIGTGA